MFICPLVLLYVFSSNLKNPRPKFNTRLTLNDSFEKLQGVETDDWSYVHTKEDTEAIKHFKALYNKNKLLQFSRDPTFKIPKTVHLIWIGPRPFPLKSIANIRSWIAHHPDWQFIFWTDRKRPAPCNGMEVRFLEDFDFKYLKEKYNESKNWGEKADIWRYEILYKDGGVYIDHDAKCIRPFHSLHMGYDFYAGLEMPHEGIDDRSITAGIGVIGSKPYHPVIKATMKAVLNRWDEVTDKFKSSHPLIQARKVIHRTYLSMTYSFKNNLDRPENKDIIFPACYFYPKHGLPGFYSVHLYGTSWNDLGETEIEKSFLSSLKNLKIRDTKIVRVELFSLIALIGCFIIYLLLKKEILRSKNEQ